MEQRHAGEAGRNSCKWDSSGGHSLRMTELPDGAGGVGGVSGAVRHMVASGGRTVPPGQVQTGDVHWLCGFGFGGAAGGGDAADGAGHRARRGAHPPVDRDDGVGSVGAAGARGVASGTARAAALLPHHWIPVRRTDCRRDPQHLPTQLGDVAGGHPRYGHAILSVDAGHAARHRGVHPRVLHGTGCAASAGTLAGRPAATGRPGGVDEGQSDALPETDGAGSGAVPLGVPVSHQRQRAVSSGMSVLRGLFAGSAYRVS
eukprot:ctg_325.g81